MKKNIFLLLLCLIGLFVSCSSNDEESAKEESAEEKLEKMEKMLVGKWGGSVIERWDTGKSETELDYTNKSWKELIQGEKKH